MATIPLSQSHSARTRRLSAFLAFFSTAAIGLASINPADTPSPPVPGTSAANSSGNLASAGTSLPKGMAPTRQILTLRWQPSLDAAGYLVYWGTGESDYDGVEDVGNVQEAVVSDLDPTKHYRFTVTAYSEDGLESYSTNEVETR